MILKNGTLKQKEKKMKQSTRYLNEMDDVIYDKEWLKTANKDLELYYMQRGVEKKHDFRYDITILKPLMLGKEYNKTVGHKHPSNYPELYEVLEGQVIFLLQNDKHVYAINAKKTDKVIIPPNYEHIMINATENEAKTCNWIYELGNNIYETIKQKKGLAYYLIKNNQWIKNPNYTDIPELEIIEPNKDFSKPIKEFDLQELDFLKSPENYTFDKGILKKI